MKNSRKKIQNKDTSISLVYFSLVAIIPGLIGCYFGNIFWGIFMLGIGIIILIYGFSILKKWIPGYVLMGVLSFYLFIYIGVVQPIYFEFYTGIFGLLYYVIMISFIIITTIYSVKIIIKDKEKIIKKEI